MNTEATFPNGTTLGEMNAWLASLQRDTAKATKVQPPRTAIVGQTFAPVPEARSVSLTKDEARYLAEDTEFSRNQVRQLMRPTNSVGVCG